ncbi:MAG: metal-sulfur cluster assembly factor, partial [Flavobacteriales bacterium]|nr:metal-sulfur cluster assembly factor [Flavobacteriales bacterium]
MTDTEESKALLDKAYEALKLVDDPEVGLNVVDLGLIYELDLDMEAKKVTCLMTFTTEFCPMGESILANVTEALQVALPEFTPEVTVTFDPPWRQDMISDEGR